jgi:hypothetical protein
MEIHKIIDLYQKNVDYWRLEVWQRQHGKGVDLLSRMFAVKLPLQRRVQFSSGVATEDVQEDKANPNLARTLNRKIEKSI